VKVILLAPIGVVDDGLVTSVSAAIWNTFGLDVERLPGLPGPDDSWDGQRSQYNSEVLLRRLMRTCSPSAFRILGLTTVDLFIPMLSFVFGQAQLQGRVAIASSARLDPVFYGLPQNAALTADIPSASRTACCVNVRCRWRSISSSLMQRGQNFADHAGHC
jgi:archaemetzincin